MQTQATQNIPSILWMSFWTQIGCNRRLAFCCPNVPPLAAQVWLAPCKFTSRFHCYFFHFFPLAFVCTYNARKTKNQINTFLLLFPLSLSLFMLFYSLYYQKITKYSHYHCHHLLNRHIQPPFKANFHRSNHLETSNRSHNSIPCFITYPSSQILLK